MVLRVGGTDGADAGGAPPAVGRRSRTGPVYGGRAAAPNGLPLASPRRQQAELVARGVGDDPPRQLAPAGVELAAAELDDPGHHGVRVVVPPRAGCRGAAGSWRPGPWAPARGTARAARRAATGAAAPRASPTTPAASPDSSAQNAASRAGSALSSGSAAIGPRVGVLGAVLHDAERVALGVGEHHPRHVALADVEVPCPELEGPLAPPRPGAPRRRGRGAAGGSGATGSGPAGSTGRAPARRATVSRVSKRVGLVGERRARRRAAPPRSGPTRGGSCASMTRFSRYMPRSYHARRPASTRWCTRGRVTLVATMTSPSPAHGAALRRRRRGGRGGRRGRVLHR